MSNKLTHSADTPKSQITDLAGCLLIEVECRTPSDAMLFLSQEPDAVIAKVLSMINPSLAMKILQRFPEDRRQAILPQTPSQCREQWERAQHYPEGNHYPVYPVCDESNQLVGLVRGYALFEEHTIQITAQAGRMVGVEDEERLATSWKRSLKFRQPWLQLNHITAFVAAFVVGLFEHTIDKVVALAVFLPVLAGQSGNTGYQALAVTLRGLTLGELLEGKTKGLVTKEAWLGLLNGLLVGLTAGFAMYLYARGVSHPSALALGMVVFLAMTGCCVVSGVWGALAPLGLKKIGADPATASSIFFTTATDVASMGLSLGLATIFVL